MNLVPIPWQPHLFVAPSYLARLEQASDIAGHKIRLNNSRSPTGRYLSAWRALEEAIYLYDLYKNHGGAIASNPYTGKRYHLRGAGGDILNRGDRAAMLAAGFLPDPDEWWHFSDPNWASMPVIAINSQTVGHGRVTLMEEDDMPITDADAQTIAKTQIILPGPWRQASIAETLAGTRARAEDTYLMVSALTTAVSTLAASQGLPPTQLAAVLASAVEAKLADDFAAVKQALSGATLGLTDDVFDALTTAVADEQDRRARLRLGQ